MTVTTSPFFALLARMKYIRRWGLMHSTREENLSEHSLQTAQLAQALALIGNRYLGRAYNADRAAALALYHDASEIFTGDLPTPVKYADTELRDSYKKQERLAGRRLLRLLPEELRDDYAALLFEREDDEALWKLVHAADKLAAYIKCAEELQSGNNEYRAAAASLAKSLDAIPGDELRIFRERFLPAFSLTLDEQGAEQ